jgi:hypothetical protein
VSLVERASEYEGTAHLVPRLSAAWTERLDQVWLNAKQIQLAQAGTTEQGPGHCSRVEANVGRLLHLWDDRGLLRGLSVYLMCASAALHDIGKERRAGGQNTTYDHGEEAARRIMRTWQRWFDDYHLAKAVAAIVSVHASGKLRGIDEEYGHTSERAPLRAIASLFRMADILECTSARALHVRTLLDPIDAQPTVDDDIQSARSAMTTWNRDGYNVTIVSAPDSVEQAARVSRAVTMMDDTLNELDRQELAKFMALRDEREERVHFPSHIKAPELIPVHKFLEVTSELQWDKRVARVHDNYRLRNVGLWPIFRIEHEFPLCVATTESDSEEAAGLRLSWAGITAKHGRTRLKVARARGIAGGVACRVYVERAGRPRTDEVKPQAEYTYSVDAKLSGEMCEPQLARKITAETEKLTLRVVFADTKPRVVSIWRELKGGANHPSGQPRKSTVADRDTYTWESRQAPEVGTTYNLSWRKGPPDRRAP